MQRARRLLSTPFGSAIGGGLVVAIAGLILIEVGVIDAGQESVALAPAPLTQPASENTSKGLTVNEIYDRNADGVAFIKAQITQTTQDPLGLLPQQQQGIASGSGFLTDTEGHV